MLLPKPTGTVWHFLVEGSHLGASWLAFVHILSFGGPTKLWKNGESYMS